MVVSRTIHPFPRCPDAARESRQSKLVIYFQCVLRRRRRTRSTTTKFQCIRFHPKSLFCKVGCSSFMLHDLCPFHLNITYIDTYVGHIVLDTKCRVHRWITTKILMHKFKRCCQHLCRLHTCLYTYRYRCTDEKGITRTYSCSKVRSVSGSPISCN